jgi:hypothetical protein
MCMDSLRPRAFGPAVHEVAALDVLLKQATAVAADLRRAGVSSLPNRTQASQSETPRGHVICCIKDIKGPEQVEPLSPIVRTNTWRMCCSAGEQAQSCCSQGGPRP